jgi:NitT/TauT family transport system substrate-binding protein
MSTSTRRATLLAGALGAATVVAACGSSATGGGSTGGGSNGNPAHVTIMVGGLDKIIYLTATLTKQLGYFDQAGVDVNLVGETAGVGAEDAVVAGQADGAVGFYDHTIDLQGKDKIIESVVQLNKVPGEVEVVASGKAGQIKSASDLGGRNLGVTGAGSSTDLLTHYLATSHGVPLDQVKTLPVGAGDTFIAAIDHGSIDAGMTTEPTVSRLVATGKAKVLIDMRTEQGTRAALGGTYPAASLFMRTDWVNQHKDTVQRVVNAFVKTLTYIHSHTAEQIADQMPHDYYANNKQLYITALKASLDMFTTDGHMPADGPATVFQVLNSFDSNVKGHEIQLNETFTSEFVDKANGL